MRRARVSSGVGLLAALVVAAAAAVTVRAADDKDKVAPGRGADQEALKAYAPFVGSWRGIGQVERGRTRGFWRESADWAWKLTSDSAGLEITVKTGKYLKAGVLRPGKVPGAFVFEATLTDGTSRTFAGQAVGDRKRLVLTADAKAPAGGVRRVSIDPLHDSRVLVLLEAEDPERHTFSRLGEVGYTREGVAFASGRVVPALHRYRGPRHDPGQIQGQDLLGLLLRLPRPVQRRPRVGARRGRRGEKAKAKK